MKSELARPATGSFLHDARFGGDLLRARRPPTGRVPQHRGVAELTPFEAVAAAPATLRQPELATANLGRVSFRAISNLLKRHPVACHTDRVTR